MLGGLGEKDEVYSDAWKSEDLRVWRRERWPTWSKRYAFACVVHGDDILVLGGRDAGGDYLREAWRLRAATDRWEELPRPPWCARAHASAVVSPPGGSLYLLGGERDGYSPPLADAWVSDDCGQTWRETTWRGH